MTGSGTCELEPVRYDATKENLGLLPEHSFWLLDHLICHQCVNPEEMTAFVRDTKRHLLGFLA
jgi:hypothetical protein